MAILFHRSNWPSSCAGLCFNCGGGRGVFQRTRSKD
uniref:Uncharacterized protein n=1 Tax=Rhizophora mucronata TaxID=61149 RepID=A0A2P2KZT2_RHIMU